MTSMDEHPGFSSPFSARALRIVRAIDAVSVWSGKLCAWLVLPLMGVLVYEVVSRYGFSAPTLWAYDFTYMLYGSHFMLVAAFTLARQNHIRTDFVYRLLPVRWQGRIDAALYLLFFLPAIGVFLWVTWDFAAVSWARGERSIASPWMPIIYPLKAVLPISAALLLLQGIAEFLKSVIAALEGRWP